MKLTLEQRILAAHGPPAYMLRLRRIEDLQAAFVREVTETYETALARLGEPVKAEAAARRRARLLDIAALNALIDSHNRYYPIEANLPMDVRSHALMDGMEPWRPLPAVTVDALVAQAAGREADILGA